MERIVPLTLEQAEQSGWEVTADEQPGTYVTIEDFQTYVADAQERYDNLVAELESTKALVTLNTDEISNLRDETIEGLQNASNELASAVSDLHGDITQVSNDLITLSDSLSDVVRFQEVDDPQRGVYPIVLLPDKCKIIATFETGKGTGQYELHEILGANKYNEGTDEQFYAVEVANPYHGLTLNTNDAIAVDTAHGREYVQYVSAGDKRVYYGDLSTTGGSIPIEIGGALQFYLQRKNDSEITINVRSLTDETITVPVTHVLNGASSEDAVRKNIAATPEGAEIDLIQTGLYVLAQYWFTYNDVKYSVVAGSDDNAFTLAWMLISTANKVNN